MEQSGVLKRDEQTAVQLRSLYQTYGYLRYKMSKFEEYDFYARNKDFWSPTRLSPLRTPMGS